MLLFVKISGLLKIFLRCPDLSIAAKTYRYTMQIKILLWLKHSSLSWLVYYFVKVHAHDGAFGACFCHWQLHFCSDNNFSNYLHHNFLVQMFASNVSCVYEPQVVVPSHWFDPVLLLSNICRIRLLIWKTRKASKKLSHPLLTNFIVIIFLKGLIFI